MAVGDKTERIRDEADRVSPAADFDEPAVKPYVPAHVEMPEFTWPAVVVGAFWAFFSARRRCTSS